MPIDRPYGVPVGLISDPFQASLCDARSTGCGQVVAGQHLAGLRQPGLAVQQEDPTKLAVQDWPRAPVQDQDDWVQHRKVTRLQTLRGKGDRTAF